MRNILSGVNFKLSPRDIIFLTLNITGLWIFYVLESPWRALIYFSIVSLFCYLIPQMKKYFFSSLVIVLPNLLGNLIRLVPYLGMWPFEMLIIGLICWLIFRKVQGVDFSGSWSLRWSKVLDTLWTNV